jgi:hypothetical protein
VTETPKVQAPVEAVTTQAPPLAAAGFTADQLAAAAAFMSAQAQQAPAVAPTVAAPAKDIGAPPTEPHQAESSDASGEADEVLDEDSVRRMDFASLLALAVRAGLEPPDTIDSQTAMADWLVKELTAE